MTLGEYLKYLREEVKGKTLLSVSDSSKILNPNEKDRQISAAYLKRIEDGVIKEINPKKLQTLATIFDENYYYLYYLAGYIDQNPKELTFSNELLLHKSIDLQKVFNDQTIRIHFSGGNLTDDRKKILTEIIKILTKNT